MKVENGVFVVVNGMIVYVFDKDKFNVGISVCIGLCEILWLFYKVSVIDVLVGFYMIVKCDDGSL